MNDKLLKDETLTEKLIGKGFWLYLFAFLGLTLGYLIWEINNIFKEIKKFKKNN